MKYNIPNSVIEFPSKEELFRMQRENDPKLMKWFEEPRHQKREGFLAVTYYSNGNLEYLGFISKNTRGLISPYIAIEESGNEGRYYIGFDAGSFDEESVNVHASGFEEGPGTTKKISTKSKD